MFPPCGVASPNDSSFRFALSTGFSGCEQLLPPENGTVELVWTSLSTNVTLVVLAGICVPACVALIEGPPQVMYNRTAEFGSVTFTTGLSGFGYEVATWTSGCAGEFSPAPCPHGSPWNATVVVAGSST